MSKLRALTKEEVAFTIDCLEEDTNPEDQIENKESLDWICANAGNPWAWCLVRVTCTWKEFHAVSYLGACSYESEAKLRECDYFKDLCDETLESLNQLLAAKFELLSELVAP